METPTNAMKMQPMPIIANIQWLNCESSKKDTISGEAVSFLVCDIALPGKYMGTVALSDVMIGLNPAWVPLAMA